MYTTIASPLVKGTRNIALGLGLWGVRSSLKDTGVIKQDDKLTDYSLTIAALLFAVTGANKVFFGE